VGGGLLGHAARRRRVARSQSRQTLLDQGRAHPPDDDTVAQHAGSPSRWCCRPRAGPCRNR
jgi:hypothetical protein